MLRNTKTVLYIFIAIAISLVMVGCYNKKQNFEFAYSYEDITKLEIIYVDFSKDEWCIEKELPVDCGIIDDIENLDTYYNYTHPCKMGEALSLKISYKNGEYEIIQYHGNFHYYTRYGVSTFINADEFDSIINKYLAE